MSFKNLFLKTIPLLIAASTLISADNFPYSQSPPGGLKPEQCPMFVCFGFDDNAYPDGVKWFRELVKDKKNPGGSGNPLTYDGSPVRATFFCTGSYGESDPAVEAEWKLLMQDGHEIANHTWSHPHGRPQTLAQWKEEISKTTDYLKNTLGVSDVYGFRTPFLEGCANTYEALKAENIFYDCSIEAGYGTGWQGDGTNGVWWWSMAEEETRKHLFWPHTLDEGTIPPTAPATQVADIKCAGLCEIPVYTYLKSSGGELPGFDFNVWKVSSKQQFVAILKYNFDTQFSGNRCPISINAHTDYYSEFNDDANTEFTLASYTERKQAVEEFLDYVLTIPEVRVVPFIDMISWMKNPVSLGQTENIQNISSSLIPIPFEIKSFSKNMVEFSLPTNDVYTFSVRTVQGRTIVQKSEFLNRGNSYRVLMRNSLAGGSYVVRISNGKESAVKKAVFMP